MGRLILPAAGAVYLDADAIIYAIEKIDPYAALLLPLFEAINRRALSLVGSELLLVETLVKPISEGDVDLEAAFRQFLTASREMALIPVSRAILERALELRVIHRIRTPDAIHAATALLAGCTLFVTNDPAFRRIDGLPVLVLDDQV